MAGRRVALKAFGCKVNQCEVQQMRRKLVAAGWSVVPFGAEADAYVVHTCAVTATACGKSRRALRAAARRNPSAFIVASGCYAEVAPDELSAMSEVDLVVGTGDTPRVADMLTELCGPPAHPSQPPPDGSADAFADHTRAFLMVQSGCDRFCTYCIVPRARGGVRSRPLEDILEETRRLLRAGHREIVLSGTNLGAWGEDLDTAETIVDVIRAVLDQAEGRARVRLSSIEVGDLSDAFLDLFASSAHLCPHLHVPLQSGSEAVLRLMGRPYTPGEFVERIKAVLAARPECTFGTDVMVGFPGETEDDFLATCELIRKLPLVRAHVFRFSPREGTRAAEMAGRVPSAVSSRRARELRALAAERSERLRRAAVGRERVVLVESRRDRRTGAFMGFTEDSLDTAVVGADNLVGRLCRVRITGVDGPNTYGVALDERGQAKWPSAYSA